MKIEYNTTAVCTPERFWEVLSKLENWATAGGMVAQAKWVEGEPWQPGSNLVLELAQPAFKFKSTVEECNAPHKLVLKGSSMGVNIEHSMELTPKGTATEIRTWMELSGPAVFLINDSMKQQGSEMFARWFDGIKKQAESGLG